MYEWIKKNAIINTEENENKIEMLGRYETVQKPAVKLNFPALGPTGPDVKPVVPMTKYVGTTSE